MAKSTKRSNYILVRNYVPVGVFLKQKREKAGFTQREVAEKLGYSSGQFISNMEAGIMVPPLKKLALLVDIYKVEPNSLVNLILDSERSLMIKRISKRR